MFPDGKEHFHHVARGVDNAGPGQVDSATDADCTEVEGDPDEPEGAEPTAEEYNAFFDAIMAMP